MAHRIFRLAFALFLGLLAAPAHHPAPAHAAAGPTFYLVRSGSTTTVLSPGAIIQVVARNLPSTAGTYCLGLLSLHDRYGIPVSLGVFHRTAVRTWTIQALVPRHVFPAEPPGPFLLYAGRCTTVAPDGNFGSMQVTIVPSSI